MKYTIKLSTLLRAVLAGVLLLNVSSGSAATTLGYTENTTTTASGAQLGAFGLAGFEFTPTTNMQITELGFYALSIGGGDAPHVSVFQVVNGSVDPTTPLYDTGNILTSIVNNTGAWTYVPVTIELDLTAGNTYLITAPVYWIASYTDTSTFTYGAEISNQTFVATGPGNWSGWANSAYNFDNLYATDTAYTSANFQYVVTPEPSTYAMLIGGLCALIGFRKMGRRDS